MPEKLQITLVIKSLSGDGLRQVSTKHPDREYCVKWKRGSRVENRGKTKYRKISTSGTRSLIEWEEQTKVFTANTKGQKLMKVGIERGGSQTGILSSNNLVAECVIDLSEYIFLNETREYAFPIQLSNHHCKMMFSFCAEIIPCSTVGSCTSLDSLLLSELCSTADTQDGILSPRTLLQQHDESVSKVVGVGKKSIFHIHIKKLVGLPCVNSLSNKRLRVVSNGTDFQTSFKEPRPEVSFNKKSSSLTCRWGDTKKLSANINSTKLKVSFSIEDDEANKLGSISIDILKYVKKPLITTTSKPAKQIVSDYAFPVVVLGETCKIQMSFEEYEPLIIQTNTGVLEYNSGSLLSQLNHIEKETNISTVGVLIPRLGSALVTNTQLTLSEVGLQTNDVIAHVYSNHQDGTLSREFEEFKNKMSEQEIVHKKDMSCLQMECNVEKSNLESEYKQKILNLQMQLDSKSRQFTDLTKRSETDQVLKKESSKRVQELERALQAKSSLVSQLLSEVTELKLSSKMIVNSQPRVASQPTPDDTSSITSPTADQVNKTQWIEADVWEDDDDSSLDSFPPTSITSGTPWAVPRTRVAG